MTSFQRRAAVLAMLALALPAATSADRLTVVTEEFYPLNYTENGKLHGYAVDIAETLLARTHIAYDMTAYPWARAYQMAQRQPNVLIFSIVRTPKREKQFHWIAAISKRQVYLFKLAQRHDIKLQSMNDLFRYTIASNRDDVAQEQLEALGLTTGKHIDLSNRDASSLQKLVLGRVDLMVGTEAAMQGLCRDNGVDYGALERTLMLSDERGYYIAASIGTPAHTVDALRDEFGKLQKTNFLKKAADKYGVQLP